MRITYNKLIRDRIPDIIDGHRAVTRVLDSHGYEAALRAKLVEEAQEAEATPVDGLAEELADVLEVLQALADILGASWQQIVDLAAAKREERGGFTHRLFLEHVETAN